MLCYDLYKHFFFFPNPFFLFGKSMESSWQLSTWNWISPTNFTSMDSHHVFQLSSKYGYYIIRAKKKDHGDTKVQVGEKHKNKHFILPSSSSNFLCPITISQITLKRTLEHLMTIISLEASHFLKIKVILSTMCYFQRSACQYTSEPFPCSLTHKNNAQS